MATDGVEQPGKSTSNIEVTETTDAVLYSIPKTEKTQYPRHTIFKLCVLLLLARIVWILTEMQSGGSVW